MNRSEELTKQQFWTILDADEREFFRQLGRRSGGLEFLGAWRND